MTASTDPTGSSPTRLDEVPSEQFRRRASGGQVDALMRQLAALEGLDAHLPVDQLTHALQTATRAERHGAPDELIVAALCHDLAKNLPHTDHARLGAEILRPFVSDDTYWVLRTHQVFQARHYAGRTGGGDPEARRRHRGARWYATAERFSDDWDCPSFDAGYDTLPLEHFRPVVARVLAAPQHRRQPAWRRTVLRVPGARGAVRRLRSRTG